MKGEDPDEETEGFTLLHYLERKGMNQFSWGEKKERWKIRFIFIHPRVVLGFR